MTPKPKVENAPAAPTNYSQGRRGEQIKYVVIHTMQGTLRGTKAWFADPKAMCSAHFSIGFDGELIQHVGEADTAWHTGNWQYNKTSCGIELEGFMERGFFPPPMLDKLTETIAYLCDEYSIPRDRLHIIGHVEVPNQKPSPHTDPGPKFPWDELMSRLKVYGCAVANT